MITMILLEGVLSQSLSVNAGVSQGSKLAFNLVFPFNRLISYHEFSTYFTGLPVVPLLTVTTSLLAKLLPPSTYYLLPTQDAFVRGSMNHTCLIASKVPLLTSVSYLPYFFQLNFNPISHCSMEPLLSLGLSMNSSLCLSEFVPPPAVRKVGFFCPVSDAF